MAVTLMPSLHQNVYALHKCTLGLVHLRAEGLQPWVHLCTWGCTDARHHVS